MRGKRLVQFGYGKVGKGVAWRAREEGMDVTVVGVSSSACARAERAGYRAINNRIDAQSVKAALARADIVVGMTGIVGAVGETEVSANQYARALRGELNARSRQAGQSPQPYPQSCRCVRSPR